MRDDSLGHDMILEELKLEFCISLKLCIFSPPYPHLLIKDARYHVGESLLPSMKYFLDFIDLEKKFNDHGFLHKVGSSSLQWFY